jgi:hypothetical protein
MKARFILWLKGLWIKCKKPVLYLGLILALLSLFYLLGRISTLRERKQAISNQIALIGEIKESKITIEGLENTVWEKDAVILSEKQAKEAGLLEIERLKKLHLKEVITNTELTATVHRQDSLLKLPPNTVYITIKDSSGIKRDYIRIPFVLLNEHDKYISLDVGIDTAKSSYYKLEIPFAGSVSVGYVKSGFLKSTPKGIFITENPFITVNNMEVLIVKEPDKFWNKTWFHALAAITGWEAIKYVFKK